jgi:uncharacterized protein (TIGR02265 family)
MAEEQRVVFGSGFDSLFSKEIRAKVTPALDQELRSIGIRLDKPFHVGFPIEIWAAAVAAVAKHVYPQDSTPEAYLKLGRSTIHGFCETLAGRALFPLLRLIGPVRALDRAARNYAATNNYTKVTLTRIGPTAFDFYLNEKHTLPEYDMGVLEEALRQLHVVDPKVTLRTQDAEGFTMRLDWTR